MFKIYTDSSFKDGVSTHHYYIMKNGRKIKKRTFIGIDETSLKAECTTVIKALQWVLKKNWKDVTVYTDSLVTVCESNKEELRNEDYRFIAHLLKVTGAKLEWKRRNYYRIKKADRECRKMMKTKLRRVV